MKIKKVCSVNGDQPIRSNPHGLTALPAQHVTRMKTRSQQPKRNSYKLPSRVIHVVWPYS